MLESARDRQSFDSFFFFNEEDKRRSWRRWEGLLIGKARSVDWGCFHRLHWSALISLAEKLQKENKEWSKLFLYIQQIYGTYENQMCLYFMRKEKSFQCTYENIPHIHLHIKQTLPSFTHSLTFTNGWKCANGSTIDSNDDEDKNPFP